MGHSCNYENLDLHCQMILEEYDAIKNELEEMKDEIISVIKNKLQENNMQVAVVEGRVKGRDSLASKLELKGGKYQFLSDITDIIGVRVVAFYNDDVDRVASIVENKFEVDWENSVDKRKMHELDSFGYNSLHYICRLPGHEQRFEIQMRTVLQHMWATMYHDTGYKSDIDVPKEYLRTLNRLAGMMELADDEFSRIRSSLSDYRWRVQGLLADRKFDDVELNTETFRNYLELKPFDKLNKRIAAINQAEIIPASLLPYTEVLRLMGMKTLGDVERLINDYGENAYQFSTLQLGKTDYNILASIIGVQNLCIVYILINGGGIPGLEKMFTILGDTPENTRSRAERVFDQASKLRFMNR